MTDKQLHLLLDTMLGELQATVEETRHLMPPDAEREQWKAFLKDDMETGDFVALRPLNDLVSLWCDRFSILSESETK